MGITIKQIAEMAGVHRSTVDKVLHGRPGVSAPVRQRIQKIIDECNYQANPIGKALQMQDKKISIRVILLDVDANAFLQKGIEEGKKKYASFQVEFDFVTIPYPAVDQQAYAIEKCIEDKVDGVIINPVNTIEISEKIMSCIAAGIPVVTVNADARESGRLCFIGQDGYKAGRIAGRLMGEFLGGKGKLAIFTSDGDNYQTFPFGTREEGFQSLIAEKYPDIQVLPDIYTQEKESVIRREMRMLCEQETGLDGIFITCGGVRAVGDVLEEYGRKDLKLICYEDYPEILKLLDDGIVTATLDSGIEKQGRKALECILDYIIYRKEPEKEHFYTETRILLKESI